MNQKNRWMKISVLGLCAALLLSGCGGKSGGQSSSESDVNSASSSDTSSDAPKDYSKYNNYLKVANLITDEIEPVLSVYFENVDATAEFTVIGDYSAIKSAVQFFTSNSYPVKEALEYAKENPAYPEADAAILAMGDSMLDVMTALDHLASYMRFDDFEDDNMAKAPELHAELWQALQTYDQYYLTFLGAISDMANQSRDEDLSDLLESEEMILYHSLTMIHTSEDILDGVWEQIEAANAETGPEDDVILPEIDMTELSPLFEKFNTAYDGLNAAMEDQGEVEKVFTGALGESAMNLYTTKVNSLYSNMGRLAEALMGGTDYADAFTNVNEAIDSMISGYNSII